MQLLCTYSCLSQFKGPVHKIFAARMGDKERQIMRIAYEGLHLCSRPDLVRLAVGGKTCLSRQGCCAVLWRGQVLLLVVDVIGSYCVDQAEHNFLGQRHSCKICLRIAYKPAQFAFLLSRSLI